MKKPLSLPDMLVHLTNQEDIQLCSRQYLTSICDILVLVPCQDLIVTVTNDIVLGARAWLLAP